MKKTRLLLLDYDGVIVDSAQPVLDQTAIFCNDNNLPFTLTHKDFDRIHPATFTMLAQVCGIPPEDHRRYGKFLFETLQSGAARIPLFSGIAELLQDLSATLHLSVVTANHSEVVRSRLADEGLETYVHTYYGSDRPGGKAVHIRQAMDDFSVDPCDTWMVGDSASDIEAAKQAGAKSIAATWGWQSIALLKRHTPDHLFTSPAELHEFFGPAPPSS